MELLRPGSLGAGDHWDDTDTGEDIEEEDDTDGCEDERDIDIR